MTEDATQFTGCSDDSCPCTDECPLTKVMDILGGKWKIAVLCALNTDGTTRYNSLRKKIKGITNTMLASSLKELEAAGLISRMQYAEMPVRVEYSLTSKCNELMPVLRKLAEWELSTREQ